MHIGLVERGGDRNAVLAHIPDVDNGDPRHAASLAPTDTKSGNRHRNAEPTWRFAYTCPGKMPGEGGLTATRISRKDGDSGG
jgi:hypothetical protein